MSDTEKEKEEPPRRMVCISVTPCDGVEPETLYAKIKETIKSQPEYELKWDAACKVEGGCIAASFSIALEADFDEEVMDILEYMEGEVAKSHITFQTALE